MRCLRVKILFILPLCSLGIPYGSLEDMYSPEYSYDEDNEVTQEEDVDVTPKFVTETMNLVVTEGDTIVLPCVVTRLAGFVLLWRYNNNIITVGDQLVATDNRYSLESRNNGNNLRISLAEPADQGEYVCSISAYKPVQIHHRVTIRVRPSIETSPVKSLTVIEGEEASLACHVMTGDQKHKLKWRRKGMPLPSGEEEIIREVLKIKSVTPEYEGIYECVLEDKYGEELVTKEVQLHVQYGPVIEQEETHILTDTSDEYHITCTVYGNPSPTVVWLRDGHPVEEDSEGMVITESGSRHILIIQDTRHGVGGEYSCQANNTLGVVTKYSQLSAYAEEAKFTDNPLKSSPHSLQLEWTARSVTPITIFRLQFMSDDMADWSEVEALVTKQDNDDWYGKADLINLAPATEYRVQVASKNLEGYNKFSRVHTFTTLRQEPMKQSAISLGSSSHNSGTLSIFLLALISCLTYIDVFRNCL